jgi:AcrR family transcriptional regulator
MPETALTPEQILDAAAEVLRRFGPAKTTVVDVARALGVSHGSVYRHFASKAALRDAVAERWLAHVSAPLTEIAEAADPSDVRLRRWLDTLIAFKHAKVLDDPELFETYRALTVEARAVVTGHTELLRGQLIKIIDDGVKDGTFEVPDPRAAAGAIFDATIRFHSPAHAADWSSPDLPRAFEEVWRLLRAGLGGRRSVSPDQPSG